MTISKKKINKIEGFGLILVLFSFFIQLIETGIESAIREQENYQIQKKIDHLWAVTSNDYSKKHPDQGVHFVINFKYYFDNYKIYSQDKEELSNWEKLVKYEWFTNARLLLFILGSMLLIIPKFMHSKD